MEINKFITSICWWNLLVFKGAKSWPSSCNIRIGNELCEGQTVSSKSLSTFTHWDWLSRLWMMIAVTLSNACLAVWIRWRNVLALAVIIHLRMTAKNDRLFNLIHYVLHYCHVLRANVRVHAKYFRENLIDSTCMMRSVYNIIRQLSLSIFLQHEVRF